VRGMGFTRRSGRADSGFESAGANDISGKPMHSGKRPRLGNLETQNLARKGGGAGESTTPLRFPHIEKIQQATGLAVPLRGVVDESGCRNRGAVAYTEGTVTHFATAAPEIHVAAHEAAHQLQHAGLVHDAGLGAEGHAGAVADAVRAGRSAAPWITRAGRRVPADRARNYVESPEHGGRLSETGETLTFGSHAAFAAPGLISTANTILKNKKSGIALSAGAGSKTVNAPDGSGVKNLSQVIVTMEADPSGEQFYSDCRQAAREVMGPKGKDSSEAPDQALARPGGTPLAYSAPTGPLDLLALTVFIDRQIRKSPGYPNLPAEEKRKIADQAVRDFAFLDRKEREKLKHAVITDERARELGIDRHAVPEVGEAFASYSGRPRIGDYNFHYAAVIMAAGPDRITLENAGGDQGQMSKNWKMQTYGPANKEGQTFHDQWAGKLGPDSHTLRVRTQPMAPGDIDLSVTPTRELLARYRKSVDPDEQAHLKQELQKRSVYAWVEVHKSEDLTGDDEVYLWFGTAAGMGQATRAVAIPEGASHVFTMPLSSLWPLADPLHVNVMEWDVGSPDDLIGSVPWRSPYGPVSTIPLSAGRASYTLTLSL
jgi:hypothetical protein